MQVTVYKNPLALRFIRCLSPIPGSSIQAGGAGLTLDRALNRCESEVIERSFERDELWPKDIHPAGIAAHFSYQEARERALQESVETFCVKQLHADLEMRCLYRVQLGGFVLGIARTSLGYFCMIRGFLNGVPIAAYSASLGFFSTLLKTWEEYQSMKFFKPKGEHLKRFTKANRLFTEVELAGLHFVKRSDFIYRPDFSSLKVSSATRAGRTIVYFYKSEGR